MNESVLVSVVIPVYNVEQYLDRCVKSVINQTYPNLEIILVDDGSPDKCPILCDEWAKKDKRIKVIHKKNAGLGMARNTGIDNSTGAYICFFDSDDYIEINAIYECVKRIQSYKPDIILFGSNTINNKAEIVSNMIPDTPKDYYENDEIINYILPNLMGPDPISGKNSNLQMSAWAAMYSNKLIKEKNWRFVSEREYISEDFYSLLSLYKYVTSVVVIKEAFYNYCYNSTSLTHAYRKDRFEKVCFCHNGMLDICKKLNYPEIIKQNINHQFLGNIIFTQKMVVKSNLRCWEKVEEIRRMINDKYFIKTIRELNVSEENLNRKIYIFFIKHNCALMCYILLKLAK